MSYRKHRLAFPLLSGIHYAGKQRQMNNYYHLYIYIYIFPMKPYESKRFKHHEFTGRASEILWCSGMVAAVSVC